MLQVRALHFAHSFSCLWRALSRALPPDTNARSVRQCARGGPPNAVAAAGRDCRSIFQPILKRRPFWRDLAIGADNQESLSTRPEVAHVFGHLPSDGIVFEDPVGRGDYFLFVEDY